MSPKTITAPAAQSNAAPQTTTQQPPAALPQNHASTPNPFAKPIDQRTVAGVVAIESERAVAEAQGKLVLAKRFPRNQYMAFEAMRAACQRPGLANEAFYEFKRGDGLVRGPSIRLAEELARCWGNVEYGMRELSNDAAAHSSELLAFAWDLETNVQSSQQFTVRHKRDGGGMLTSERDIYEIGANMGARRMRSRILAILPADFVDAAVQICTETAKKSEGPLADSVKKLITAFASFGVTTPAIEQKLGHALLSATADDLVTLRGIYNAINKGGATPAEYFAPPEATAPPAAPAQAPSPSAAPAAPKPAATPPAAKETPKPEAKTEAPKPEAAKATTPASSPAATNAPAEGAKPETKAKGPRRQLLVKEDKVDPATGEVTEVVVNPPKPEGAPPATEAPAAATADAPATGESTPLDDDLFAE